MTIFSLINVLFSFFQEKTKCISFSLLIKPIKLNGIQFNLLMNRPYLEVTFSLTHSLTQSLSLQSHKLTFLLSCYIKSLVSVILYNIINLLLLKWSKIKISNNYCQDCLQGYFDIKEIIFFVFKEALRSSLYDLYFEMR